MYIRPLTREDLPAVAWMTNQTFAKDELYKWLYPHQDLYPDDLRRFQVIRLRTRLVDKGSHGFVMVTEQSDSDWTGRPEVMGFAFYVRSGDDEAGKKWQTDSWFNKFERYLLSWESFYESKICDRASDPARIKARNAVADFKFYSQLPNQWHLGMLSVSPKYQRRGVGGKLVQHGQKIAAQENVPVTLDSSVIGRFLYAKNGFKVVEEGEIVDGLYSVAMVWEPEHLKGTWLEDLEEGKARVIV